MDEDKNRNFQTVVGGREPTNNGTSKSKYLTKTILGMTLLMIIGVFSYAFFSYIGSDNKNQTLSLKNGTMALRFADNDNGINATMNFGETVTKKFIIENTGTVEASLSLDWYKLINTYKDGSLSYNLTYSENEDGEYKTIVPETNMPTSFRELNQLLAGELSVPAGETYYFNLNVTLNNLSDVNQDSDLNATFTTTFSVDNPSKYRYYLLTVDPNGGTWNSFTAPQEYYLKNDETLELPDPVKQGSTFEGWSLDGVSSEIVGTTFSMGISDAKLIANWSSKMVNVTVDGVSQEVEFESTLDLGEPPLKEGYTFTGWSTTGGTIEGNTLTVDVNEDIVVTSTYVANNYKYIVYHSQMNVSGSGYTLVEADTDEGEAAYESMINPDVKTYVGFTAPEKKSLKIQVETEYPPVKNKVEYEYTRNQHTLSLKQYGPDGSATTSTMYYGATKNLGTPSMTNYTFQNWTATSGTLSGNNFTMGDVDATVTANFIPKTSVLTFNANGGTVSPASKLIYFGERYGELPTPTRDNYEFLGWFVYQYGTWGNEIKVTANTYCNEVKNITIYAKWKYIPSAESTLAALNVTPKTGKPDFTSAATTDEGVYPMEDDDGTAYYFRGAVTNNYVKFGTEYKTLYALYDMGAGSYYSDICELLSMAMAVYDNAEQCYNNMPSPGDEMIGASFTCEPVEINPSFIWRIVRVNGDGSLKLVYDGKYEQCSTYSYTLPDGSYHDSQEVGPYANGAEVDDRFAFLKEPYGEIDRINPPSYQSKTITPDAKYVGWMYGGNFDEVSTSKEQAQQNDTDSNAKKAVDEWFQENIDAKGYTSYLADKPFCNDRSTADVLGAAWLSSSTTDTTLGYGSSDTAFGSYKRLLEQATTTMVYKNNLELSFKCPQKNDAFTVTETENTNGALTYPVGLLTIDEILAAGAGTTTLNKAYYLYKGDYFQYSMTPLYMQKGNYPFMFGIHNQGGAGGGTLQIVNELTGYAPVINVKAEYVESMSGSGTMEDPYFIP